MPYERNEPARMSCHVFFVCVLERDNISAARLTLVVCIDRRSTFLTAVMCLLARNVLFEGYTESLTVKLMNKGLSERNLTIRCSVPSVVRWGMYCQPLYDGDCTNTGFEVRRQVLLFPGIFHIFLQ